MNDVDLQTYGIIVYINRKLLMLRAILALLFIVGMDVFAIWAFWNHYEIDTGAYVAALLLLIFTIFMGLILRIVFCQLRQHSPVITINLQGFSFDFPQGFVNVAQFRQSFIPWEEIEWIGYSRYGMSTQLSLRLKDPDHYWSHYGNNLSREWHQDALTGADMNITQYLFSLSIRKILQQVEKNCSLELYKYEVKVKH